ncbi:MAG: DUF4412 domain-containing protein, partial [Chitinophagaceae bacterium]|nr:DUF4412 domain-containing protein [Chitinophagaceae bacterium]
AYSQQDNFNGVIRYHMMGNDVSQKDSMFIIFGNNKIRFDIYMPPDEKEAELTTMIVNFADSTILMINHDLKKYFSRPLSSFDQAIFNLADNNKIGLVAGEICQEYKGSVKTPDGKLFEAATLVCKDYPYTGTLNFNFLGMQPVVANGKIVLAYRTRLPAENENTYIMAYQIERGNTDHWFELKEYQKL